jgi:hypothetical protein
MGVEVGPDGKKRCWCLGSPELLKYHDENDLGQEEIYIALEGSATLLVDGDGHTLEPGVLARIGPGQKRRILPEPDGFRMVAVGGRPGEAYRPPAWTELGGPLPGPPSPDRA